jgi:hypothetical protein
MVIQQTLTKHYNKLVAVHLLLFNTNSKNKYL